MSNFDEGTPPAAKLEDIIDHLFENEKINGSNDEYVYVLFSHACLTEKQKQSLVYPNGHVPLDYYIIYQTDQYDKHGNLVLTSSQLVSFVKKSDGFIYGDYYILHNQRRLRYDKLTKSRELVELSDGVEIVYENYLEVYHNVLGTTVILGLSTELNKAPLASLQYSHKSRYFYDALNKNGIQDPNYPTTRLIGLSRNLEFCR